MKHYLRLSSLIFLLFAACASPYRHLQHQPQVTQSALRFKPVFDKTLYRCTVDGGFLFKKFHFSGLLFFKTLENGTVRAIYQNEMGYSFFDFEWDSTDSFKVHQVIPQFDKPAVIRTFRKDLELFLMKGLDRSTEIVLADRGNELFYRLTMEKGYAYYIERDERLIRIENADDKKKVVTIHLEGKNKPGDMPQKATFEHHKANFTIQLNKLDSYANE